MGRNMYNNLIEFEVTSRGAENVHDSQETKFAGQTS
jgi:hypothetical protein